MVDALSPAEWLEAARRSLGAPPDAPLRLERVWPAEGSDDVSGFVGDALGVRVRVRGPAAEDDAEESTRELPLFLKMVPRSCPARQRLAVTSRAFHKEIGLFERLFPRIEAGAGAGASMPWGPRCVLTRPHLMAMEDLATAGFRTLDNRSVLDRAHVSLVLAALARFHAGSLALEVAVGQPLNLLYPDLLQENMFSEVIKDSYFNLYFTSSVETIKKILRFLPEFRDSPRYAEILEKLNGLPEKAYKMVKPSKRYSNAVCHGDLWVCNFMFRYSKDGTPVEVRLLDYQEARYCPPAVDVMSLLHLTMRREAREALLPELLAGYHAELAAELARRGLDAERLLPRRQLDESCAAAAAFGRVIAASYMMLNLLSQDVLRLVTSSPEQYDRLMTCERSSVVGPQLKADPWYRDNIAEIMSELVHFVLLAD